jgi:DNA-binding response OmpR family regulator
MVHVLVVDDDPTVSDVVRRYLEQDGCRVRLAADGPAGLAAVAADRPDLVVLDLMMPGLDGLEVCRRLRAQLPDLPVVMLTALGEEADRVVGLEVGADDYVTKPFSPRELVARVKAVLRRSRAVPQTGRRALKLANDVELRPAAREVKVKGVAVDLTPREYDLLTYLALRVNVAVSRDELLEAVWGFLSPGETRTVDVHVASIRRRLGEPGLIRTVRGIGYKAVA